MINAGELDQQITLQPLTVTRGADGSVTKDYSQSNVTVWAQYIAQSGREFYAAQKQNAEVQAAFKIRYRTSIDTKWRVKYGNRYFEILFINDTSKRQGELMLACKEEV